MLVFEGLAPYRGFTLGPVYRWTGWGSAEALLRQPMPVVVVADYLDQRMVEAIDPSRVRGIVCDHASCLDPVWDKLAGIPKPSLVGASGVLAAVDQGETAIVDGTAARIILRPDARTLRRYERLRGTRPQPEPPKLREVLDLLVGPIRHAWTEARKPFPFDCPEQRQLYRIAYGCALGQAPSKEDDALVARLLFEDVKSERTPRYRPPGRSRPGADGGS